MAVLLKCGATFLHIPKTGGTWVTKVLQENSLVARMFADKHADLTRALFPLTFATGRTTLRRFAKKVLLLPHVCSVYRSDFRFCFVRHPLGWYESFFKYQSGGGWPKWGDESDPIRGWHPNSVLNGTSDEDFNRFVRKVVAKRPGYVTEMYGWYTYPRIDFIGKQERLADDLIAVLNHLNVNFDEDRIRSTRVWNDSHKPRRPLVWEDDVRRGGAG